MIKINLILTEAIKDCNLEKLFGLDFNKEEWIWVNNEIFADLAMNAIDYDSYDEKELVDEINKISETELIKIVRDKMKEIGWTEVNQLLFEKLEDGFNATKDINTFIFAKKKFFMLKMIAKMKELQWALKAMAVDAFQHLTPEIQLRTLYEEDFEDNFMILEEFLISGQYKKNNCVWKVMPENGALVFYKNNKQHRVWAEGNANFIFNELSK
ncbi:hypothetical protein [Alkaliphilus transvaalensis]|uniref:hypothetical protein n=1 Tax=Alkaliphilus transvaalensis TaxID=114628 RepID=UPI000479D26D|nr:hypothetical protein [Alkaliphilus transvaalensis]